MAKEKTNQAKKQKTPIASVVKNLAKKGMGEFLQKTLAVGAQIRRKPGGGFKRSIGNSKEGSKRAFCPIYSQPLRAVVFGE